MTPGSYSWTGGIEQMLCFGPGRGPVVVAAMPLFEEANRTRAFLTSILRALADGGIGGVLPDLPGQGESIVPTSRLSTSDCAEAFAACVAVQAAAGRRVFGMAIRSGALLDASASLAGRWHLSPQDGAALQRELVRIQRAAGHVSGGDRQFHPPADVDGPVAIAGNLIPAGFIAALGTRSPVRHGSQGLRVARLQDDVRPADVRLTGSPLWRRAEPDNDFDLVEQVSTDIIGWVAACDG